MNCEVISCGKRNLMNNLSIKVSPPYAIQSVQIYYCHKVKHILYDPGSLNDQKYQDEILESGFRSPLDSLDGQNMVLRHDIASPHCTRIIEEYKNQQNITSLPRLSLLSDLNPI